MSKLPTSALVMFLVFVIAVSGVAMVGIFASSYHANNSVVLTDIDNTAEPDDTASADLVAGEDAAADNFAVIEADLIDAPVAANLTDDLPKVLGTTAGSEIIYTNVIYELPLTKKDYYYRKYENGRAGANEINRIPVLYVGQKTKLIAGGYITVSRSRGYLQPPGYTFASGLCWSTSALGGMMDVANSQFKAKYGLDLFTFDRGDRAPHSHYYSTYAPSNRGRGYTVIKLKKGGQDFGFRINPALANKPDLKDIKVDIEMMARTNHPQAYKGQSIGAILKTNKQF